MRLVEAEVLMWWSFRLVCGPSQGPVIVWIWSTPESPRFVVVVKAPLSKNFHSFLWSWGAAAEKSCVVWTRSPQRALFCSTRVQTRVILHNSWFSWSIHHILYLSCPILPFFSFSSESVGVSSDATFVAGAFFLWTSRYFPLAHILTHICSHISAILGRGN